MKKLSALILALVMLASFAMAETQVVTFTDMISEDQLALGTYDTLNDELPVKIWIPDGYFAVVNPSDDPDAYTHNGNAKHESDANHDRRGVEQAQDTEDGDEDTHCEQHAPVRAASASGVPLVIAHPERSHDARDTTDDEPRGNHVGNEQVDGELGDVATQEENTQDERHDGSCERPAVGVSELAPIVPGDDAGNAFDDHDRTDEPTERRVSGDGRNQAVYAADEYEYSKNDGHDLHEASPFFRAALPRLISADSALHYNCSILLQ